jgi:hypothetical protein
MTVVPVNVEAEKRAAEQQAKAAYKTPNGWVYPGRKTFIESNRHCKRPDTARMDELRSVSDIRGKLQNHDKIYQFL